MSERKRTGRPRKVQLPVDLMAGDRPEAYPSLLAYLEATDRLQHLDDIKVLKARKRYLAGGDANTIADELSIPVSIIDRMSVVHGWAEERDKRLFEKWRKVSGLQGGLTPAIDERHDRIAGTIEQQMERLLLAQSDGRAELSSRDLKIMASTLKDTMEIRRTIRGKSAGKTESEVTHVHTVPDGGAMEKLALAIESAMGGGQENLIPIQQSKHVLQVSIGTDKVTNDNHYEED